MRIIISGLLILSCTALTAQKMQPEAGLFISGNYKNKSLNKNIQLYIAPEITMSVAKNIRLGIGLFYHSSDLRSPHNYTRVDTTTRPPARTFIHSYTTSTRNGYGIKLISRLSRHLGGKWYFIAGLDLVGLASSGRSSNYTDPGIRYDVSSKRIFIQHYGGVRYNFFNRVALYLYSDLYNLGYNIDKYNGKTFIRLESLLPEYNLSAFKLGASVRLQGGNK